MGLAEKIKMTLGFGDEDMDYEDEMEMEAYEAPVKEKEDTKIITPGAFFNRRRDFERNLEREATEAEDGFGVNIVKPRDFNESMALVNELKKGRMVVINTGNLDLRNAQRLIDFVSGSSYALGGDIQEVVEGIYIVSPKGVNMKNSDKTANTFRKIFS